MKHYSIAIDGPAGAGKGALSKKLAKELNFRYLDTGAIYRTVGYYINLMGIGSKDRDGILRLIDEVNIKIEYSDDEQIMILNGMDVTEEIRTPLMSKYSSDISAIPAVREFLLDMQRDFAKTNNVIMDGRDIGTVVLPEADVKIYLTATPEERAKRRYNDLIEKGQKADYDKVLKELNQRDENDMNRAIAPLKKAADAIEIDTTGQTEEESAALLLSVIKERLGL